MSEKLKVGDRILIISDRINSKVLANVQMGEIVTVTGLSEDGKIIYHNNSLALPNNTSIYKKI